MPWWDGIRTSLWGLPQQTQFRSARDRPRLPRDWSQFGCVASGGPLSVQVFRQTPGAPNTSDARARRRKVAAGGLILAVSFGRARARTTGVRLSCVRDGLRLSPPRRVLRPPHVHATPLSYPCSLRRYPSSPHVAMCFVASCNDRGSVLSLRFEPLRSSRALAAAATAAAAGPEAPERNAAVTWWDTSDADHLRDLPALVTFTEKRGEEPVSSDRAAADYDTVAEPPLPDYYDDDGDEEMADSAHADTFEASATTVWPPSGSQPMGPEALAKQEPMSPISIDGGAVLGDPSQLAYTDGTLPDRLPTPPPSLSAALSVRTDGATWSDGGGLGSADCSGEGGSGPPDGDGGGVGDGGDDGCGPSSADVGVGSADPFSSMFPDECLPLDDVEMAHERRLGCVYRKLERVGGETIDGRRRRGRKRVHPKPPSRMLADLASIDGCTRILEVVASEATARQVEMQSQLASLMATRDELLAAKATSPSAATRSIKLDDWAEALDALTAWSAEPEAVSVGAPLF